MNDTPGILGVGTRLDEGPAATLAAGPFAYELGAAGHLLRGMSVADLAHVALLARAGVVDPPRAARLLDGLLRLHVESEHVPLDPAAGDLYNNRDRWLEERLGDDAGFVHTGRARREATTIAWQLACRTRLLDLGAATAAAASALASVARDHAATLMPDYTYLQHAHPTTLGHYLLSYAYPLLRDCARVERAVALVNRSPAGSGSVNGNRFGFDREWVATLLGFEAVVEHTRDAMWAPDMATEQLAALVSVSTNLDRLAEDLQLWATEEFGFLVLDDSHCRTSVIMPQKRNPYALTFLRGQARTVIGRFVGVVGSFLTPSGQPDNRVIAYDEVPVAIDWTVAAARLAADVLEKAHFDVERMGTLARSGYAYATDLCDVLVLRAGVDNRTAHRVVGRAVRDASARDGAPVDATAVRGAAASLGVTLGRFDDAELDRCLDLEHLVALRAGTGGAAPTPLEAMLRDVEAQAEKHRAWFAQHPLRRFEPDFLAKVHSLAEELMHA